MRRPRDASRRAAAMPAAPAPTMTTSTVAGRAGVCGAGADRFGAGDTGAPSTGPADMVADMAAEAARNDRRFKRLMVCRVWCMLFWYVLRWRRAMGAKSGASHRSIPTSPLRGPTPVWPEPAAACKRSLVSARVHA